MSGQKIGYAVFALAAAVGAVALWLSSSNQEVDVPVAGTDAAETVERLIAEPTEKMAADESANESGALSSAAEPQTEEEMSEVSDEAAVVAFDAAIEKWQEPRKEGISMADVASFVETFRKVPEDRRDEEIHHALNLIPDENVMLLAGVLLDKAIPKEIVEAVFNDVLNRDEDVKKPILQEIFKDKTHPCWAETAWILDVTGELPKR